MTFDYSSYERDIEYKKIINSLIETKLRGYFGYNGKSPWTIIKKGNKYYVRVRDSEEELEINSLLKNV